MPAVVATQPATVRGDYSGDDVLGRASAYLEKVPGAIQGQEGSKPFMAAARSMVWGFDLGIEGGIRIITDEYNPRCSPEWADWEIRRACERANEGGEKPRGHLLAESRERSAALINPDPANPTHYTLDRGEFAIPLSECVHLCELPGDDAPTIEPPPVPSPSDPPPSPPPAVVPLGDGPREPSPVRPVLRPGVEEDDPEHLADLLLYRHRRPDGVMLRSWNDQWYLWEGGVYRLISDSEAEDLASQSTSVEFDERHHARSNAQGVRQQEAAGANVRLPPKPKVTIPLIRNVLFNTRNRSAVRSKTEPCWVDRPEPPAGRMIAFRNGILDLNRHLPGDAGGNDFMPPTPQYFTRSCLDFEYHPNPPAPTKWHAFLRQIWPGDSDDARNSIALLQQWFGYVVSGDNSRQKFLAMVGAKNGGKGVICNVMRGLVGSAVVASPTLHTLSGEFGLANLDGKELAIVGDMRTYPNTDVSVAVERILNITGNDYSTINAKNKQEYEAKLKNRFMIAANGLPKLYDTSAALIRRTLMLRFTIKFTKNLDTTLSDTLRGELPGIFAWAIDGLRVLSERNQFTQPASGQELIDQFESMMSVHSSFVMERCVVDADSWESYDRLYADWKDWCSQEGKRECGTKTDFKSKLLEVVPELVVDHRPRDHNPDRKRGYKGIRLAHPEELSNI